MFRNLALGGVFAITMACGGSDDASNSGPDAVLSEADISVNVIDLGSDAVAVTLDSTVPDTGMLPDRGRSVDATLGEDARILVDASVVIDSLLDASVPQDMLPPISLIREDDLLEEKRAEFGWPGVAAVVFVDGREIVRGRAGVRVSGRAPLISDVDRFHLGSCTKAMTATLLGRYVDLGLVRFDSTIASIFSDMEVDPSYSQVTLGQLIRHEGGTPGSLMRDMPDLWSYMWANRLGDQRPIRTEIVRRIVTQTTVNEVGRYEYSNAAYIIVGAALERITGDSWESLMQTQIFEPLEMTECGFGMPAASEEDPQPWGHRGGRDGPAPVSPGPGDDNPTSLGPAGTVHCSLASWVKFVALHTDAVPHDYLSTDTLEALHAPSSNTATYAGGWNTARRTWAGGVALTHTGSNTMNYAVVWAAPEKNAGVLVVTNIAYDGVFGELDSLVWQLLSRYVSDL